MEHRYCVYNRTTDRFLSVGTTVVHTVIEPFGSVELPASVENVTAEWGLCVVPAESLSTDRFAFPIGVVYLDADQRVLRSFEWTPGEEWPDQGAGAASVLALPSQSVVSSRTHPGDQFIICAAEELVRHLARIPSAKNGSTMSTTTQEALLGAEPSPEPDTRPRKWRELVVEVPNPQIREFAEEVEAASHPTTAKISLDAWHIDESYQRGNSTSLEMRQTDLETDEIDSVVAQVLQWSRPGDGRVAAASASPFAALDWSTVLQQPLPELERHEGASLPHLIRETDHEDEPPVVETLDESEDESEDQGVVEEEPARSEFDRAEIDSVVSQVLEWGEQTGRPVARLDATLQMPPSNSNGNHGETQEESQNGRRTPSSGANGKNGARTPQSRFGRWADEITQPLTNGLKSKPVVRIKIRTHNPEHKNGGDSSHVGFGLAAVLQKFKQNGKVLGIHTLKAKFTKWLDEDSPRAKTIGPMDRRRSSRHALPDLIAYYWTGGTPQAHRVGDISCNGFYLLTDERWVPETVIRMTLQRTCNGDAKDEAISVLSKVVRWGKDGVGHEFVLSDSVNMRSGKHTSGKEKVREALQEFI